MNTQHIRCISSDLLQAYLFRPLLEKKVSERALMQLPSFSKEYVLYHSWKPGFLDLSEREARHFMAGTPSAETCAALKKLGWDSAGPVDFAALARKCVDVFSALQNLYELEAFLRKVHERPPKTVVEIGTWFGGTLYGLSQVSAADSLFACIDSFDWAQVAMADRFPEVFRSFAPRSRFEVIQGSSRDTNVKKRLLEVLGGRQIDLLFIDGDRSYDGVKSDFQTYAPLVADQGSIVFHDICKTPEGFGPGIEVGLFWQEIQQKWATSAVIDPTGARRKIGTPPGVPVVCGIGIVEKSQGSLF